MELDKGQQELLPIYNQLSCSMLQQRPKEIDRQQSPRAKLPKKAARKSNADVDQTGSMSQMG